MFRQLLFCGAMLVALPAAAEPMDMKTTKPTAAAMAAPSTADYMKMAGQSDRFEIESGRLAAKSAKSADLKQFGSHMVTDHTKSTEMVMAAAKKSGLPVAPPPMKPEHEKMLTELRSLNGAAFDKAYLAQQLEAHQKALDLHSSYAKDGDDANLKAAAKDIVPVVTMHLEMLRKMDGAMKTPA